MLAVLLVPSLSGGLGEPGADVPDDEALPFSWSHDALEGLGPHERDVVARLLEAIDASYQARSAAQHEGSPLGTSEQARRDRAAQAAREMTQAGLDVLQMQ